MKFLLNILAGGSIGIVAGLYNVSNVGIILLTLCGILIAINNSPVTTKTKEQ